MSYFFHHPYELDNDSRMQLLRQKMWCEGTGIFWDIFMRLRRGRGLYPLSALIAEVSGGRDTRARKVQRVLTDFDLFVITNGMVELASGLSVSDLLPKKRTPPQERIAEIHKLMNEEQTQPNLFPEESRQMLEDAMEQTQQQIREQNAEAFKPLNF